MTNSDLEDGGPAFAHGSPEHGGNPGMTLRDWFAGQALVGILASGPSDHPFTDLTVEAFEYADAMLDSRELP